MKSKFLFFSAMVLLLVGCSPANNNNSSNENNITHEKSALFQHVEELSENIQYVPNFVSDDQNTFNQKNAYRAVESNTDYSKNNPYYQHLRTLDVKDANNKIDHLKNTRELILRNTYMLDKWIKFLSDDFLSDIEETEEYKRVSFDSTLDVAKLEYVTREKRRVEGDFESEYTSYIFLKSSYDVNNKIVISGSETIIRHFINAATETKEYEQNSFSYHESNYLNYLSESDISFSQDDIKTHSISLMNADLTKENPIISSLDTDEVIRMSLNKPEFTSLRTTIFHEGEIAYSSYSENRADEQGIYSNNISGTDNIYIQDDLKKTVCQFFKHNYDNGEGHFYLDLTEMSGYTSFLRSGDELTLKLSDGREIKLINIVEEGNEISALRNDININTPVSTIRVGINIAGIMEINIQPKEEDYELNFIDNLNYALTDMNIGFKHISSSIGAFSILNNLEEVASNYSFFNGNVLEKISFEQAYGLFSKYVDDDVKGFDEMLAMDFSSAVNENEQEDDDGVYSLYSSSPTGTIRFSKDNNKLDLSDLSLSLSLNPLMKQGDEFSYVAALKKENGGIVKILDEDKKSLVGEGLTFNLHNNISLPEIELGAYRIVTYLIDKDGNKVSALSYPIYEGDSILLTDGNDVIINITNNNGFFISKEGLFLKDQSLIFHVHDKEYEYAENESMMLTYYTLSGIDVYLSTSYFEKDKKATLTLSAVSNNNEIVLLTKEGMFGTDGSLSIDNTDLLVEIINNNFFLANLSSPLPSGEYHFSLKIKIDEEYEEEINVFNCYLIKDEDITDDGSLEINDTETNFVLSVISNNN